MTRSLLLARPSRASGFAQWSSRSCQWFPMIGFVAVATCKPFAASQAAQVPSDPSSAVPPRRDGGEREKLFQRGRKPQAPRLAVVLRLTESRSFRFGRNVRLTPRHRPVPACAPSVWVRVPAGRCPPLRNRFPRRTGRPPPVATRARARQKTSREFPRRPLRPPV